MTDKPAPKRKNPLAGRKPGSRNRNSAFVKVTLDKLGFNVIERYIQTMEELPSIERMEALKFLMKFVYPQLKDIDHETAKVGIIEEEFAEMKPAHQKSDQELLDELNNEILISPT